MNIKDYLIRIWMFSHFYLDSKNTHKYKYFCYLFSLYRFYMHRLTKEKYYFSRLLQFHPIEKREPIDETV